MTAAESVLRVELYGSEHCAEWDSFVRGSRNATFLFERGYMEYHADRFVDASLLVRDGRGRIRSLLPANREGNRLVSHGGLTYGGFVVDARMGAALMLEVFDATRAFLAAVGVTEWIYKPVPHVYHIEPSEEDLYALFHCDAVLFRRDVGACASPAQIRELPERVKAPLRKAHAAGLSVEESQRLDDFWPILEANLANRHGTRPVHALTEIQLLQARFPSQIRLFLVRDAGQVAAGAVVYETTTVAHIQYAAATEEGRRLGAPALLLADLLRVQFSDKRWLDHGISTENDGSVLNAGLQDFKEGFGLRSVVSDFYRVPLTRERGSHGT